MAVNYFDEHVAANYDNDTASEGDTASLPLMIEVLATFAANGPALEFAIGTGRVALPLANAGVEVTGIELSQPMVDQLRAKPGGEHERIPVIVGDMATAVAPRAASSIWFISCLTPS